MKIIKQGKNIEECNCKGIYEEFLWALDLKWIILKCDICEKEIEPKEAIIARPLNISPSLYYHFHFNCLTSKINVYIAQK